MAAKFELLRVASPRECNAQQTGVNDATARATDTQQTGLKALARRALACNNTRNNPATTALETVQQTKVSELLRVARPGECNNATTDPVLEAFVDLVRATAACDFQMILHHEHIAGELDADDLAELRTNTREDRQAWAQLLAYRLTRARIAR